MLASCSLFTLRSRTNEHPPYLIMLSVIRTAHILIVSAMSSSPSVSEGVPHELAGIGVSCQNSDTNIPSNPVQVGKNQIPPGRWSVIQDYCRRAGEQGGGDRCIWLCIKRGRKTFATDMRLENIKGHFGIHVLQKHHSWWKRHSFYSAVGVKIIKVRELVASLAGGLEC